MTRRKWNFVWIIAAALALAACSVSRLAYLNAPPLTLWYLSGYVELTDPQKTFVRDRMARALAWHRQAELPEYQRSIEMLIGKMDSRVSVEEARTTYKQVRAYYHRLLEHMLPDFADFIVMLDASQTEHLQRKFADENRKLVKESVQGSVDDRRERRGKKYIEQFEEWTGRLSRAQREIVLNGTRDIADFTEERLGDRRYRQGEIIEMIRAEPPREKVVAKLRSLFIDTEAWRRPEYTRQLRERDEHLFAVVSELSATLTAEQRESVQRKMRGYVKDISSIIASR